MGAGDFPLLTAIIVTPIVGALLVLCTPARRPSWRAVGFIATAATLGLAAWLLWDFNTSTRTFQFVEETRWFDALGVGYIVGVDGFSIFMVCVTALLFPIGLLASAELGHRIKAYTFWFLLLEGAIMGIFLSLDLICFFVFWEAMLVPMYFLIAGWGSSRRVYAAMKFFIYTAAGSAFLLASILVLGFLHQSDTGVLTFDYRVLAHWNGLASGTEKWLFLGFMAAFAIKAPLFPFHTWLPDVHTEAPTAGSVVLAGVILKMGAYGFLRFSFELFPQASVDFAPLIMTLAVIGIIYGSIVAAMQTDAERVIAFSSVAHMGFILLGIFSITIFGLDGASFTMLSHPLTTGALFLVIGMLYERRHTREISEFGGIWKSAPVLTAFFLVATFAGIGLPGFSGFVGEFLSLLGGFIAHRWWAVVATAGVILAAVYMLWMFQRVFTGVPDGENAKVHDVTIREVVVVAPLLALSLFIGLYPKPVIDRVEPTVKRVIANFERRTDYEQPKSDRVSDLLRREGVAMNDIATPGIDWLAVAPVIALAGAALVVIMLRAVFRRADWVYDVSVGIAVVGIGISGIFLQRQWDSIRSDGPYLALSKMLAVDGFAVFLGSVVLAAALMTLLLSSQYLGRQGIRSRPEYVALLLLSATGMLVMTTANDLIVVFIALETLSIPLYVLAAYDRNRLRSLEAGMKYFVLGVFSSAVFLYGIALVYGATGTTSLSGIADFLGGATLLDNGTLIAGLMLLLVGLGFKVAAVPFHMWTPDVYEGAPTPITAFMASATKAAGFAALLRVLLTAFASYRTDWRPAIWALAILTLLVGSIVALVQTDIKRMLAYSSISHAGYVLIGLEAGTRQGLRAALFYLAVYTFMVIGSFAVVTAIGRRDNQHSLTGYRGLATRQPLLAALLAFFLLAQAGIPPTGGFMAKLGVFSAVANPAAGTEQWLSYSLLVVGVIASVISAFFYLRVIVTMYASEAEAPEGEVAAREAAGATAGGIVTAINLDVPTGVVLVLCAVVTLWVGILPTLLLDFAKDATLIF